MTQIVVEETRECPNKDCKEGERGEGRCRNPASEYSRLLPRLTLRGVLYLVSGTSGHKIKLLFSAQNDSIARHYYETATAMENPVVEY